MLGMVVVHVTIGGEENLPAAASWALHAPSGRSAVLFFMLSGVTLSVLARRGTSSMASAVLRRRGLVLFGFGLLAIHTFWPNSILHSYGVMFLLAPWLLVASRRLLLAIAALAFTVGPLIISLVALLSGEGQPADGDRPGQVTGVVDFLVSHVTVTLLGQYALVVWVGFFVVGVLVGRLALGSRRVAATMLVGGVAFCAIWTAGIGAITAVVAPDAVEQQNSAQQPPAPVNPTAEPRTTTEPTEPAATAKPDSKGEEKAPVDGEKNAPDPAACAAAKKTAPEGQVPKECAAPSYKVEQERGVDVMTFLSLAPHSQSTAWALQSLSIAIAALGACLLVPAVAQHWLWPIRAVGTVSLTIYLLHTFFVQDVWTWFFAITKEPTTLQQLGVLAGILAALVAVAMLIRRFWSRGPAEWVLAQLSRPS